MSLQIDTKLNSFDIFVPNNADVSYTGTSLVIRLDGKLIGFFPDVVSVVDTEVVNQKD